MKIPFPEILLKSKCVVKARGPLNANGVRLDSFELEYRCYFEQSHKVLRSPTGEQTRVLHLILIKGDIIQLDDKAGYEIVVGNKVYKVDSIERLPDIDGSIHHTELLVM